MGKILLMEATTPLTGSGRRRSPSAAQPVASKPRKRLRFEGEDTCASSTACPSSQSLQSRPGPGTSRADRAAELCAAASKRPGVASEKMRASQRRKAARLTEQADAITALPGRTRLETLKVSRPSRRQYLLALWLLACWSMGRSQHVMEGCPSVLLMEALMVVAKAAEDDSVLDDMCAGFLNDAFWAGVSSGLGGRVANALGWFLPKYQRQGTGCLPRLHQCKATAMRRAPGGTRLPLPEELVMAILMTIAFLGQSSRQAMDVCLALLVAHHCYLRPCELLRIHWKYVTIERGPTPKRAAITLHPSELWASSKTGEYDESVIVDEPWIVRALALRKRLHVDDDPICPVSGRLLQQAFDQAQERLGLVQALGRQTLYVFRHSGASADAWRGRRTQTELQRRGRWKAAASARRYEKGGRVAERLARCSAPTVAFAEKCMTALEGVLCERRSPLRPP